MKICLIHQSSGLGDILFSQKISRIYLNKGFRVINPIIPTYQNLKHYIQDMEFPLETENFPFKDIYNTRSDLIMEDDFVYIPLFNAQKLVPIGKWIMEQKYQLLNLEWEDWATHLKYKRNLERENKLFYEILDLKDNEEYNFISQIYKPFSISSRSYEVKPNNKLRNVYLDFIENFELFDWLKVVENASNIFMIESSLCYLIETIKTKSKENVLWSRNSGPNKWIETKHLFNFPWEYVE
jgi:hypothetical protein